MKPLIRWAGSKTQLLGSLRAHWTDDSSRYVEPFAGSAALFFDLEPRQAILGDINCELISTLRAVRQRPRAVLAYLRGMPMSRNAYYQIRSVPPDALCMAARAARFLYLNRNCFNGLYRTNRAGEFNVPFGPPKSGYGVDESLVLAASSLLKRTTLVSGDFEHTLAMTKEGDFVYLDPPYAVARRRVFAEYGPASFSTNDLERLSASLADLHNKRATFVITYADSKEARMLLKKWRPRRIWTRRNIAGFAAHRRGSYELLATNSPSTELR